MTNLAQDEVVWQTVSSFSSDVTFFRNCPKSKCRESTRQNKQEALKYSIFRYRCVALQKPQLWRVDKAYLHDSQRCFFFKPCIFLSQQAVMTSYGCFAEISSCAGSLALVMLANLALGMGSLWPFSISVSGVTVWINSFSLEKYGVGTQKRMDLRKRLLHRMSLHSSSEGHKCTSRALFLNFFLVDVFNRRSMKGSTTRDSIIVSSQK